MSKVQSVRLRSLLSLLTLSGVIIFASACGSKGTPEERLARADALIADGSYRAASIELKDLLQDDTENVHARILLAKVDYGFGDFESAEAHLRRAAESGAPGILVAPLHLDLLIARGRYRDALEAIDVVAEDLTEEQRDEYRGRVFFGLGEFETAKEAFVVWQSKDPENSDAQLATARASFALGEYSPSVDVIRELVADFPDTAEYWDALGMVEAALGNYDASEDALVRATQLYSSESAFGDFVTSRLKLADIRLTQNKLETARETLEELEALIPGAPAVLFLSARLLRAEGDFEEAARRLQLLINVAPDDLGARLILAQTQLILGNIGQAEALAESVIGRDVNNVEARKLLATIELNRASPAKALKALDPVSDLASDDSQFLSLLARAAIESGDIDAGIEELESAAQLSPQNLSARNNLAAAYLRSGRAGDALGILRDMGARNEFDAQREGLLLVALELVEGHEASRSHAEQLLTEYSDNLIARFMISEFHFRQGDAELAYKIVADVAGYEDSEQILASLAVAQLDLRMGRAEKGKSILEAVLKAEPDQLGALIAMADLSQATGDLEGAKRVLVTAVEKHPKAVTAKARLADVFFQLGEIEEAERLANDVARFSESNGAVADVVGKIYLRSGRYRESATNLEHALRFSPSSRDTALRLAVALSRTGRSVEALNVVDSVVTDNPNWIRALIVQSGIQFEQGRLNAALESIERARTIDRRNTDAALLAARIYRADGRAEDASTTLVEAAFDGAGLNAIVEATETRLAANLQTPSRPLEEWLDRNPSDSTARSLLAQLFLSVGDYERATVNYEQLTDNAELSAVALNNLAWISQQRGDLVRAAELAERAYAESPESGSIADTLGWIYFDSGRLTESLELLEKAARLSPNNGEISYHLAAALVAAGNRDEARDVLRSLLSSDQSFPSRAEAESLLDKL